MIFEDALGCIKHLNWTTVSSRRKKNRGNQNQVSYITVFLFFNYSFLKNKIKCIQKLHFLSILDQTKNNPIKSELYALKRSILCDVLASSVCGTL